MKKALAAVDATINKLSAFLGNISMFFIFFLMILMMADVIGRYALSKSILGAYELCEGALLIVVCFALAYTQMKKRHISVDIIVTYFNRRIRCLVNFLMLLPCVVFSVVCVWAQFQQAGFNLRDHIITSTLRMPEWPFNIVIGIGLLVFVLVLVADTIKAGIGIFIIDFANETESVKE